MQGVNDIRDGWMRIIGIPAFAVVIPQVTALMGPLTPADGMFWVGQLLFLVLAASIWQGNRWLLFKQREHVDWFGQPIQKLIMLAAACFFGTAPVTVAMLRLWYAVAGLPVDWRAIQLCTAVNVICVVFVTHVYETVFLIKAREEDLLRVERLEKARVEAQLEALRNQIDPHFMFNALNTLSHLIRTDPPTAVQFNDNLARVYRYILANRDRHLVLLSEELGFLEHYTQLLSLRFGDGLRVTRHIDGVALDRRVLPPISLQVLLENAVKHNVVSRGSPLEVELRVEPDAVVVSNPIRPRPLDRPSEGIGLQNLSERYRLATSRAVEIAASAQSFTVRLPTLPV